MANLRSYLRAISLLFSFLSGETCQERQKYCSAFNFEALSVLLSPRWRVDVGLPYGSDGILHLAGNLEERTVIGLRVGSLANEELLLVLLALRPSLSVPRCHFKQYFHQRICLSLFRSN